MLATNHCTLPKKQSMAETTARKNIDFWNESNNTVLTLECDISQHEESQSVQCERNRTSHSVTEDTDLSRWESGVQRVVEEYELSEREHEVLRLLVRGRNTQRISSELVISNHTTKTHIYNIYRKAGVHSAQEMIDIFELAVFAQNA